MSHSKVGTTAVPSAGTRVQLSTGTRRVKRIYFKASEANTGDMYFGDSAVSATVGISLDQARSGTDWHDIDFTPSSENENFFWVDAATGGDSLDFYMVYVDGGR